MPCTRSQATQSTTKRKRGDVVSEPPSKRQRARSPTNDDDPPPATTTSTASHHSSSASGAKGSLAGAVQSSIPGLSIAEIRSILSDQRKLFQETGYVNLTDQVMTGISRLEFNYRYVNGIARKRFAKHQRASGKALNLDDPG